MQTGFPEDMESAIMGRVIGRITEVKGIISKAELQELLPPYIVEKGKVLDAPRINNYVKTKVGLDTIICQITGEYFDEHTLKGDFTGYYINLNVKGYISGKAFIQGLRCLPIVGAEVEMIDPEDLAMIYACGQEECLCLGNDLYNSTQPIRLGINKIIPSHIGIFGNTGSGKSNTLARLLNEYSKYLIHTDNAKVLVFDLNNEYVESSICDKEYKKVYPVSTRNDNGDKIPISIDYLDEDQWCIMLGATEATQRPVVKTACRDKRNNDDYKKYIADILRNGQRSLFMSLRFNMRPYLGDTIDNFCWHNSSQVFYYDDNGTIIYANDRAFERYVNNIIVTVPTDNLDLFLFKLYFATARHIGYGTQYEYIEPLLRRAEKLIRDFKRVFRDTRDEDIFDRKPISVIQLANVNRDMRELIPPIVSNYLFRKQTDNKGDGVINSIINVVIDEAHNILFEDENNRRHQSVTIETFEKIIKEGRKYGFFLWLASQRPSDISPTVISQLHNYFIHKLVNPLDLSRIRKAVAFLDDESMNMLTVLGPGECVLSGTCVSLPVFIKVKQLTQQFRPNSDNVVLIGREGIFTQKNNME